MGFGFGIYWRLLGRQRITVDFTTQELTHWATAGNILRCRRSRGIFPRNGLTISTPPRSCGGLLIPTLGPKKPPGFQKAAPSPHDLQGRCDPFPVDNGDLGELSRLRAQAKQLRLERSLQTWQLGIQIEPQIRGDLFKSRCQLS